MGKELNLFKNDTSMSEAVQWSYTITYLQDNIESKEETIERYTKYKLKLKRQLKKGVEKGEELVFLKKVGTMSFLKQEVDVKYFEDQIAILEQEIAEYQDHLAKVYEHRKIYHFGEN